MAVAERCAIPTLRPRRATATAALSASASLRAAADFRLGPWRLRFRPTGVDFGVIVDGVVHDGGAAAPADIISGVFMADAAAKAATFALVDACGLVVVHNVVTAEDAGVVGAGAGGVSDPAYVEVRGRSSRGKLSPGEFYHHDGCSGPVRPRVVEIRCPHQEVPRAVATAVAPFPATVYAMLRCLPAAHRAHGELSRWYAELSSTGVVDEAAWDLLQGAINRVCRHLPAEDVRAFFRDVDVEAGAYRAPWQMGESRLIANENALGTTQHRRAYLEPV